ncbi:MAG: endonuclease MutS2 [Candidatus Syntrophonatronum acetioxidans]|uniref:Endonuclease MutS2 n=1 Tax=Candidatus Syntrophonatronum acetioxidans TaxID=1795816 RepID=A0A424YGW7_9FIRM|nr:MAG: endonuclease MutS2 [Candidatus Syntrophonatronum acetioxidans]
MEKTFELLEFNKINQMLRGRCDTHMGRELAEDLKTVSNLKMVQKWQKETSDGCAFLLKTNLDLSGVVDLRPYLARSRRGGILTSYQLREAGETFSAFRTVRKVLLDDSQGELLTLGKAVKTFSNLEEKLLKTINEKGEVVDKASDSLRKIRSDMRRVRNQIQRELDRITKNASINKYLQENLVTQRNNRYVVPVKAECKGYVSGIVHDQSSSGATVFVEPMAVVEANNKLGTLQSEEKKEVEKILRDLSATLSQSSEEIWETLNTVAEIDFVLSKGRLSLDMEANEPLLNDESYFRIIQGRHPLLKGEVVPISVELGQRCHTMVITGPNTGGKTVTLKTIGLLSLMAMAGLHVPAEAGTETCIFDGIFADIGDEQNIEQSLSTFSGHMKNIINILNKASTRSLVLLDELGAGTDPTEGAALGMSILEHLHSLRARTIATTHYSSLKHFAYDHEEMENASVEFDPKTLQPTYRLLQGVAGSSNAFEIAFRLGLEGDIIERAKAYMGEEQLKLKRLMENLEESQRKIHQHQKSMEEDREDIDRLKKKLEEEAAELEKKKKDILQKAREEALTIVNQSKRRAERVIREVEKAAREKDEKVRHHLHHRAREDLKEEREVLLEEIEDFDTTTHLSPEELKKGQTVYIKSLKLKGTVLDFTESGEVSVQAGVMKISTSYSDLVKGSEGSGREEKRERSTSSGLSLSKSRDIQSQLDLRGDTLAEAIDKVDKYLDDSYLAGLSRVDLIHGKGSGALRKGLHDYLSTHSQVKSFRLGTHEEGGAGVTVVTLL